VFLGIWRNWRQPENAPWGVKNDQQKA